VRPDKCGVVVTYRGQVLGRTAVYASQLWDDALWRQGKRVLEFLKKMKYIIYTNVNGRVACLFTHTGLYKSPETCRALWDYIAESSQEAVQLEHQEDFDYGGKVA
jgi:hypothetical protein